MAALTLRITAWVSDLKSAPSRVATLPSDGLFARCGTRSDASPAADIFRITLGSVALIVFSYIQ